ncbi:MAG: BsuBI/PstI family type II restriction endonuclease [Gammaproteobacteria bacterium]|nr:BsuBI/PstI family type II restriction endonuclease [Gammaproteobacteria bacterium]
MVELITSGYQNVKTGYHQSSGTQRESLPALPPTLPEVTEFFRLDASLKLNPKRRAELGQYMTPFPVSRFMASLFDDLTGDLQILDPGAGVGSLTAALVERCSHETKKPRSLSLVCYEIEHSLIDYLRSTLNCMHDQSEAVQIPVNSEIYQNDFILSFVNQSQGDLFKGTPDLFTHVIMNPPYKKINSSSRHRLALRSSGIETSNLYTGFMFLAALQLCRGGEMVAIVPRSFCNGPYFKPFREQFFSMMGLQHVHVFEKRNSAFKSDEVLQENIIVHAKKGAKPSTVKVTSSGGANFAFEPSTSECIAEDMTQRLVDYTSVIDPDDPGQFIHITSNELEQGIVDRISYFTATLADLNLEVSTGPVVDFRLKKDLRSEPGKDTAPLFYSAHFQSGKCVWPKEMKKPNAIVVTNENRKWLWSNKGHYVVTRRFTSKEERRRVVASLYSSDIPGELIGFENHLNVYHSRQEGISQLLAAGLVVYLNSSLVDRFFRQFNGHTQVNATDLRSLHYPDRDVLERIGRKTHSVVLSQSEIDSLIEEELVHMTDDENPLLAQQKIDEALQILISLGMPRGQQNERSALTLLALLDMKPSDEWRDSGNPLIGITPIMDYCREQYGRNYAPNTRETFRRQTMHQFVMAGISRYNPDRPDRPVNSPKACYQISDAAIAVIQSFGTSKWEPALEQYLEEQEPLATKWAKHREMQMIPVQVADGQEINLTPGVHSELIKQIITEFAPRFTPSAEVIYIGDTGDKIGYFQEQRLAEFGVVIDKHGKMPDVVLYFREKDWLMLVESVTSTTSTLY